MNIKKEATKHSMPFLKKYGRKLMRKIKGGLDIDDTQDIADKVGYAGQKEDILSKGFALGLELTTPLTAVPAIYEQSKGEEGSFLHTALTKQPEIPAIGGFQVGHNPETDIGKRSGDFIASLPGRVINAYKKNRQKQG